MPGALFVVATPIGNLEDLTFRALRTLKEVDVIAAEDTRRTAKLLAHYEIRKPLLSVREHNEARESTRLVARMAGGESVALVTDAGTPGIADPGARLVAAAHAAGIRVTPIPGPSAVTAALSASGFAADSFVFMGFPPRSGRERADWFKNLAEEPRVVVFFEAPHRANRTIGELAKLNRNRLVVVTREMTKIHETLVIRAIDALPGDSWPEVGEFVVIVGPGGRLDDDDFDVQRASDLFGRITELAGVDRSDAAMMVGAVLNAEPKLVAKAVKKHRISVKQQIIKVP